MERTCPKCSKALPEVETLNYRFCPHCGAEIAAGPRHLDDAYLTMPPESPPPKADHWPMDLSPETETGAGQFNDETREPQSMSSRQQPKLKPPDTPPPASFFRARSDEKTPLTRQAEKVSPKRDHKKQSLNKNRKIVIVTLVILAIIILLLGALFTF